MASSMEKYIAGPEWLQLDDATEQAIKGAKVAFDPAGRYPRRSIATPGGLLSRQPFTAVYLCLLAPFALTVIPAYAALKWVYVRLFTSPASAPRWSLPDFISVYLVRRMLPLWFLATHGGIRGFFHRDLTDRQRLWRQRWLAKGAMPDQIPPLALSRLQGPIKAWAQETGAFDEDAQQSEPKSVPVWWKGKRAQHLKQPKAQPDERLLLYLTGGGYMISSCHPGTPLGGLMAALQDTFDRRTASSKSLPHSAVTVEYRKAGQTKSFVTALVDCLALWFYVVEELQFQPQNVTVVGDSAGGHIVNTVVRYLLDASLPLPGSTVVVSPWTDQAGTLIEHPQSSYQRNEPYDVLSDSFYHTCRDTFIAPFKGKAGETMLDVYFSPCAVLELVKQGGQAVRDEATIFRNWPPTFIVAFKGDVLLDQSTMMLRRLVLAKQSQGFTTPQALAGQVGFTVQEGPHDPFVAPPANFALERKIAFEAVTDWLVGVNENAKKRV